MPNELEISDVLSSIVKLPHSKAYFFRKFMFQVSTKYHLHMAWNGYKTRTRFKLSACIFHTLIKSCQASAADTDTVWVSVWKRGGGGGGGREGRALEIGH